MMKIIFNAKVLSLIFFVVAIGFVTSCKKDTNANDGKVVLLSFGPTGAKHGEKIIFIGINLDKVTAIELVGATVPASAFEEHTSERIGFVLPALAEQGFAILKTPDGDVISKTKINFEVPVKITSVTKEARPGANITITGEFMNWIKEVKFAKDLAETTFVSKSLTELVVKVPVNARSGKLFISTGGTEPLVIETDSVLVVTLPMITSLAPNPVLHETDLTITGTNLDLANAVIFTGLATPVTSFVSQSATQIVVKVPAAASKGKITLVANSTLTTESGEELVLVLPSITTLAPNPVDRGNDLTITGTNLDLVTSVSFTGAATPITTYVSQSATQIVVKVPMDAIKGKVTLAVLHSTLTVQSAGFLSFVGDPVALDPLSYAFYEDALQNNWQDWGWSRTADFANTDNVRDGNASIKLDYTGDWGALKFANGSVSTAAYTELTFSIFGTPGTGGKKIHVTPNGATTFDVIIDEGKWVEYKLTKAQINAPATITEIVFQNEAWAGTVFIDHVGLR